MIDKDSILNSVKKIAGGLSNDNDDFDTDVIVFINSVFATLSDLGIGEPGEFYIEDDSTTWFDLFGDKTRQYAMIPAYVASKVKIEFDPPQSGIVMEALNQQIRQYEWRIREMAERNGDE